MPVVNKAGNRVTWNHFLFAHLALSVFLAAVFLQAYNRRVKLLPADLVLALRTWRHRPILTAAAILTLALGTGANTAIFSVIQRVMLQPLPYPAPDRLIQIWSADRTRGGPASLSNPLKRTTPVRTIEQWNASSRSFQKIAWYRPWSLTLSGAGEPERLRAAMVSSDFLPALGVAPSIGRGFIPAEMVPGSDHVVILSDALWRRRFSADPGILGRTIDLDAYPHTVIGVMPAGLRIGAGSLPEQPDLYAPISVLYTGPLKTTTAFAIGRLRPGVTLAAARAEMDSLALQTQDSKSPRGANLVPLQDEVASDVGPRC